MTSPSNAVDVESLLAAADDVLLQYEPLVLGDAANAFARASASSSSSFSSSCSSSWDESIGLFSIDADDGEAAAALRPLTESLSDVVAANSGRVMVSSSRLPATTTSVATVSKHDTVTKPDRKARRRAQAASSSGRYRHRKKLEEGLLIKETAYLSSHLALLRSKQQCLQQSETAARWAEAAMAERRQLRCAKTQNEQLRNALFLQRTFLRNLKGMLASPSSALSMELNLHQLLHSYCRLGTSADARIRVCEAMCSDAKVDFAIRVVLSETGAIQCNAPSVSSFRVQSSEHKVGATVKGVFAFDAVDVRDAFASAVKAVHASGKEWPQQTLVDAAAVTDPQIPSSEYGVKTLRFRSENSGDELVVELRTLSCVRVTDECCVMLTDCVDVDELYPLASRDSVKQDCVAV